MTPLASWGQIALVLLTILAGLAIPWARALDRRDAANQAEPVTKSEGND